MAPEIPSVTLSNGKKMPLFGLGTYQATDAATLKVALRAALDAGYRLIDTAMIYQNEHIIGEVLQEYFKAGKLKREDIFVTTKLPLFTMRPEAAEATIPKQLAALQLDYIDLYLVHCPCALSPKGPIVKLAADEFNVDNGVDHIDTWRVLEKFHKAGKLKALGVSNFNGKQIQDLYKLAEIKPSNLQVECHIYWPQEELLSLCKKLNMSFTAYAPLGSPGRLTFRPDEDWPEGDPLKEPVILELAKKYNKSPAQIILHYLITRGISVIPKSTNPERVLQNISIFDFKLTADDQARIASIKFRVRLFEFRFCAGHRYFPFEDVDLTKPSSKKDEIE